jgi:hypothetical protein
VFPEVTSMESPSSWKPMTFALAAAAGGLAACSVLLPESIRPWNFAALGAVALFATARLKSAASLLLIVAMIVVKDLCVFVKFDWPPEPLSWLAYVGYALMGRYFIRNSEDPFRIVGGALCGSWCFFLVSNFGSWLMQAQPYGYSLAGLANCYEAAIPFHRGTMMSDLLCAGSLFAAHAVLSRVWFPAERPTPALVPVQAEM